MHDPMEAAESQTVRRGRVPYEERSGLPVIRFHGGPADGRRFRSLRTPDVLDAADEPFIFDATQPGRYRLAGYVGEEHIYEWEAQRD